MTELQKKRAIEKSNDELADADLLNSVEEPIVEDLLDNDKQEEQVEIQQEQPVITQQDAENNSVQDNVVVEEKTIKHADNASQVSAETISKFSNMFGKSEEYVTNKLLFCSSVDEAIENVINMVEECCLPVHKYNIGDYVYIPEQTVDNTKGGFGVIQVDFLRKPKRVQINKIIYTNKIQYSFTGFKKLIVMEDYCCDTEKQCEELCKKLNGR